MTMKATIKAKKREQKSREKRRRSSQLKAESKHTHDNKKLIKVIEKKRGRVWVIGAKKFEAVAETYLKPFSVDYHKAKGVRIPKGKERFIMSVVPYESKRLKSLRKTLRRQPKVDFHEFSENNHGNPDVHQMVLASKGTIPLFLDQKERRYLKHHHDELYQKYLKVIEKHKKKAWVIEETFPVPEPPKEHKNWIVCRTTYTNYIEHIEGTAHKKNSSSKIFEADYDKIDSFLTDLNSDFNKNYVQPRTKTKIWEEKDFGDSLRSFIANSSTKHDYEYDSEEALQEIKNLNFQAQKDPKIGKSAVKVTKFSSLENTLKDLSKTRDFKISKHDECLKPTRNLGYKRVKLSEIEDLSVVSWDPQSRSCAEAKPDPKPTEDANNLASLGPENEVSIQIDITDWMKSGKCDV